MTLATRSAGASAASARRIQWLRGPIQCRLSATRRRSASNTATAASVRNATRSSTRRTMIRCLQRVQRLCVVGAGTSSCAQYGHDACAGHLTVLALAFGRFVAVDAVFGRGGAAERVIGAGAVTWATGAIGTLTDASIVAAGSTTGDSSATLVSSSTSVTSKTATGSATSAPSSTWATVEDRDRLRVRRGVDDGLDVDTRTCRFGAGDVSNT